MKALLATVNAILCGACVAAPEPFVQGHTKVTPPVTRLGTDPGTHIEMIDAFNDGGTWLVKIRDATGKQFDVYFDHRIGSPTPGAIYLYAYPGKRGSVRVANQREFERKVGAHDRPNLFSLGSRSF